MDISNKIQTLSIIIPTLNEAKRLPLLLADLKAWPYISDLNVIDGGSNDLTISIAQIQGINVTQSCKSNRGYQLNLGASNAKGDWLLFLHADSRLDKKWVNKVIKITKSASSEKIAWYFNFKINKDQLQFRVLEIAVALRSYILNRPYGDQGLLIHKNLYYSFGGFSSLKIMEDLDFITRLTKTAKVKSIGTDIYTDSTKWSNSNIIERAIANAKLRNKWRKGYDTNKLSESYYSN